MHLSILPVMLFYLLAHALPQSTLRTRTESSKDLPATNGGTSTPLPLAMGQQKATIIVGYPGIGKSYVMAHAKEFTSMQVLDEPEYSGDKREEFKLNLLELATQPVVVLSPAHRDIGEFLIKHKIHFVSVFPANDKDTKQEYLARYRARDPAGGEKFAQLANTRWADWMKNMHYGNKEYCKEVELKKGRHLADVFGSLLNKPGQQ